MPICFKCASFGLVLLSSAAFGAQASTNQNQLSRAFAERTDVLVVEGDILTHALHSAESSELRLQKRTIHVNDKAMLWQDGVVPYYIDPRLPEESRINIATAVQSWNAAGITLLALSAGDIDEYHDYLHFEPAYGCASFVGKQGGRQSIWVAYNCTAGSLMHEIGHALGLEHEHTRSDRNQYITIKQENIKEGKESNFAISNSRMADHDEYDFASIMHYGTSFFSANGKMTIEPLQADKIDVIGQRIAPSEGDLEAIRNLYSSDLALATDLTLSDSETEVTVYVTNNFEQGAHELEFSLYVGQAQLAEVDSSEWTCDVAEQKLSCRLARLGGNEQSQISLKLDQIIAENFANPVLESKTHDADLSNNSSDMQSLLLKPVSDRIDAFDDDNFSNGLVAAHAGSSSYVFLSFLLLPLLQRRRSV